ncbi:MAG: DUF192 domain-containing protein [Nanoarchaeota archaeon]|nr:DUF192 domain-containing protein [Nanoarchaeota archaeon]
MRSKKISLTYKGRKLNFEAGLCEGASQGVGLIFKSRDTRPLLFDFEEPTRLAITSVFVFFPFLAIWLDDKDKIIEKKIVKPFTMAVRPKRPFTRLLEIPINQKYFKEIEILLESSLGDK